ncbi:hypothetical protein BCT86_09800 [Vibrio breoganii]|uniref:VCBS domain-containing protein n=1 Tax=Vibrio breoganii TaxID=553239 RepID=UPI000C833018|nr:VCBS domain-containing protein [Vibrio breoganii]PML07577.1 hypothetical protein BCT86_09800 [Vibrio breoganii]
MANEDKTKRVIKDAKKQNEQGRIKKTRQFSIPRTYVPRSVALILPSYHFGGKASEGGVDSEISHTEYVNTPQDQTYSPIETKGNQTVHPEPAPYIAGGDYEPPHHTENAGSHHFTQPHHYGKPVTSTPTNTFGQTNLTPIPTINSHTVEHKDYSYLTPPVVGLPQSGTVVEDTTLAVSGTVDIHSAQKGAPLTFTPDNLHGQYGEFTLNKDTGEWSYALDNSHHQNLAQGETHTEILHVTATSAAGVSVHQDITVTVQGTNDIPVITSQAQHESTKEDGVLLVNGQVSASDVDHGAVLTYTPDNLQGQYGLFSLNPSTGKWAYTLNNQGDQALAEGEHHTETMLVTVTDEHGATTTQTVTVDVEGTNDRPVITSQPQAGTVKEDDVLAVKGQVTATDVDHGSSLTYTPDNLQGQYGSFSLSSSSGRWIYKLDNNAHQALALGESHTETMLVTVTDEHGAKTTQQVTVTVEGTNDKPVITSQAQTGAVKEDDVLFVRGQVTATDIDHGAVLTYTPDSLQGHYGSFTLNSGAGTWTYKLDNNGHQDLALGEHHTDVMLVTVTDEHGAKATQEVRVEVTGTNDKPVVTSGVQSETVKEDATLFVRGQVVATDVDNHAVLTYTPDNLQGQYGSFTLNKSSGSWAYKLDNAAHQALAEGEHHTETLLVTVTDEHGAKTTQQVTVEVEGTNDRPVIASQAQTGAVKEDATLFVRGQVTATDVDKGAVLTYTPDSLQGQYGSFTLNKNSGTWTYTLDNSAHQELALGEHHTDRLLVMVTDEHGAKTTQTVTVDVEGTNDRPVITSSVQHESVKEDATLFVRGQVTASDVDNHAVLTYTPDSLTGQYGAFTLNKSSGAWTYKLDNSAHQALVEGEHHTETLLVTVTDEHGAKTTQTVTVDVEGTNDKPVITSKAQAETVKEDDVLTATGQITASDVDHGAVLTYSAPQTEMTGAYGSFTLNPSSGVWHYKLDNTAHQALAFGETHTETLHVTVTDDKGATTTQSVVVTVEGTNDKPVITSSAQSGSVNEDGTMFTKGQVSASDVDNGAILTYTPDNLQGHYGSFSLNPSSGTWTYTLDNQHHQDLAEGEKHTETLLVTVTDEHGAKTTQQVTVDVTGTNDRPVLAAYAPVTFHEDENKQSQHNHIQTVSLPTVSDVDDTQLTYSIDDHLDTKQGNPRWIDIDSNTGQITVHTNARILQHLSVGESMTEDVLVTVHDKHGGSTQQTLHLTIEGTNDRPHLSVLKVEDRPGHFTSQQGMQSSGNHAHQPQLSVNEDSQIAGKVFFNDVDDHKDPSHPHGDTYTFTTLVNVTDEHGHTTAVSAKDAGLTLGNDGHFTFDASAQIYQHLQIGQNAKVDVLVTVTDNHGAHDQQHMHFTVRGQNDNPSVNQVAPLQVDEDNHLRFTLGRDNPSWGHPLLQISDIEQDKLDVFNPTIDPRYGRLVDHGMGRFEFIPASNENADTFPGEVPVVFKIDDNHGGVVTERGYIHVNPVNDAPNARNVGLSSIDEDSSAIHISEGDLLAHTSDIDNQDTDLHVTSLQLKTAGAGQLVKDPNGGWLFTPSANWNSHKFGTDVKFSFTVSDGDTSSNIQHGGGGTPSAVATLHVNPLPDPALIVPDNAHPQDLSVTDGSDLVAEGYLTVSDPDKDESHFTATSSIPGTHGFASIDRNGHWHYTLNDKDPAVLALGAGEHMLDKVVFRSTDGTSHTINIDITGKNEAPEVTQVDTIVAVEDGKPVIGKLHVDDKDTTDMLHFSLDKPVPGLIIDPDTGVYTFEPTATFYNHLREGQVEVISAVVSVTDSSGITIKDTIEIRVTGTNDAPEATGVPMPNLYLDDTHGTQVADPKAHFDDQMFLDRATDPDTGDHLSIGRLTATGAGQQLSDIHLHDASVGTLRQDGKGGYDFIPASHFTGPVVIDYTVTDGIASTKMQTSFSVVRHVPLIPGRGTGSDGSQIAPPKAPIDQDKFSQDIYHTTIAEGGDKVTGTVHQVHVSGTHSSHDEVYGANHLMPNAHADGSSAFGFVKLQPNGGWEYHLNQHNSPTDPVNQLAVGETLTETFTVRGPNAAPTTLVVTITGTNDAPQITGVDQHIENAQHQIQQGIDIAEVDTTHVVGQLTVADIDHEDILSLAYHSGAPTDGQGRAIAKEFLDGQGNLAGFSVNAQGEYTFTPDSAHFGSIPPGQTRVFKVPVEVTDGHGGSDTQIVTLTVMGHNRPPVVANSDIHLSSQTEDFGTHTVSAQQLLTLAGASDPDGDTLHVTHLKITDTNGAPVTVRDDGQGNFIFSSKQDQHGDLHFSFEVTDGMHHSQVQKVTATLPVTAVNDKPVASDFKLGSVAESTTAAPTATHVFTESQFLAHVKDPDIATDSDKLHLTGTPTLVTGDQAKGRFEASGNGYRFVPTDPNFHGTVHVTYEVTDSAGATTSALAAIEVTATNDPAVITNPTPDYAQEDIKGSASGKLSITDVDTPTGGAEEHFQANSHIGGQFGYLQLDRDGNWNYVLTRGDKPGVQQLSAIGKLTEHFHITSQDGTKYDLSVEVRGTNDDPVLNAIAAVNGKEGGNTLSGQIHATDVDTQGSRTIDNPADVLTYETQYTHAGFSLNSATGAYSLDLKDPIFEHLAQGEKETLTVPVTVTDNNGGSSHTRNLVITVTGTNDVPVLDAITQITKNEDDAVVTGQLSAHDVDSDNLQGQHTTYHLQGSQVAGFTLNPDGSYSFDPHAYNALKVGEHKDITIPIIARDNHGDSAPQNLVIHLTGTNDAPTITGTSTATVTDGPSISATTTTAEQLHITDPDSGEAHFIQELNVVPDSTSANPGLQQSAYGHLSITADGNWQYHVDTPDAIKAIPHGETVTETFTVHSADGTQHTVAVTLQGSNEAATIGGTVAGAVTEDNIATATATATATGKLTVTDVDRGEEHFQATTAAGTYGTLDVDRNGEWTYTLNNANQNVQRLGAGVQVTDTIKVQSADGTSQDITVSITGTNDAPTVSHVLTKTLNEDSSLNLRPVMFGFTDTDQGDTLHSISLTSIPDPATEGQLLLNGNPVTSGQTIAKNQISHLVFNPVTNFNGDVHFGYKVSDGHADSAEQTATLHVTHVNDPAQISVAVSALVREDSPTGKTAGDLSISDPDGSSEEVFKAATGLHGQYGELDINEHGHWGYTMTKQSDAAIQGLKEGETLLDKVTVYSQDGTAYEVEVQISGENDSPTVTPVQGMTEQAGQTHVFSSADFGFKDIDGDALHHITVTSLPDPAVGVLELDDGHGSVSAVAANAPILPSDLDHLRFVPAQGVQGGQLLAFDYTANDGHVDSAPATLSMMLENPAPAPQPSSLSSADEADTNIIENAVVTLDDLATEQPEQTGAQAYLAHLGIVQHNHDGAHSLDTPADLDLIFALSEVIRDEHGVGSSTIMGDDTHDLEHQTHDDFNHHHDLLVEHHY